MIIFSITSILASTEPACDIKDDSAAKEVEFAMDELCRDAGSANNVVFQLQQRTP